MAVFIFIILLRIHLWLSCKISSLNSISLKQRFTTHLFLETVSLLFFIIHTADCKHCALAPLLDGEIFFGLFRVNQEHRIRWEQVANKYFTSHLPSQWAAHYVQFNSTEGNEVAFFCGRGETLILRFMPMWQQFKSDKASEILWGRTITNHLFKPGNKTSDGAAAGKHVLISRLMTLTGISEKSKNLWNHPSAILASIPSSTSLLYTAIKWAPSFPGCRQTGRDSESVTVMKLLNTHKTWNNTL